jgi:hypothetical protein
MKSLAIVWAHSILVEEMRDLNVCRASGIGFCQRVGRPTAGCDPCARNPGDCCAQTGDADNPDCICHGSSQTAR